VFELATCNTCDDKSSLRGGSSTKVGPPEPRDPLANSSSNRSSIIAPGVRDVIGSKKRSGDDDEGEDWLVESSNDDVGSGVAEELGSGAGDMGWVGYVTDWASPFEALTRGSSKGSLSWAGVSGIEDPPDGTSCVSGSGSL